MTLKQTFATLVAAVYRFLFAGSPILIYWHNGFELAVVIGLFAVLWMLIEIHNEPR